MLVEILEFGNKENKSIILMHGFPVSYVLMEKDTVKLLCLNLWKWLRNWIRY